MRIEASVEIRRPIEKVFTYVADFENEPTWYPGVLHTVKTSEERTGIGTTYQDEMRVMGGRIRGTYEVVEYQPPRSLSIRGTSGPMTFKVSYVFAPIDGGTRFTGVGEFQPTGLSRLLTPLLARMLGNQVQTALMNLKAVLEHQA